MFCDRKREGMNKSGELTLETDHNKGINKMFTCVYKNKS